MNTFTTTILDLVPEGVGISLEVNGITIAVEKMVGAESFVEFFTSMSDDIGFRVNGDVRLVDVLVAAKKIWK